MGEAIIGPEITEDVKNTLGNLYHVPDLQFDRADETTIQFQSEIAGGVLGLIKTENKLSPYFMPDTSPINYGPSQAQLFKYMEIINKAMPQTTLELQKDFLSGGVKERLKNSNYLKEAGIVVGGEFKNDGEVEVFNLGTHENHKLVLRVPKFLVGGANDFVDQAVNTGRLSEALTGHDFSVCVPSAMDMFQLMPLLKGAWDTTDLGAYSAPYLHGYNLASKMETLDKVGFDLLVPGTNFLKIGDTRKILKDLEHRIG